MRHRSDIGRRNLNTITMESKKYYLRNEFGWNSLTEEQTTEFNKEGQIEIEGVIYTAAPRLAYSSSNKGTVEMYEISDNNVFGGFILGGVNIQTGNEGRRVGINNITMPVNTVYLVRMIFSTSEKYCNARYFPDIVDAIEYFNTIKNFIEGK